MSSLTQVQQGVVGQAVEDISGPSVVEQRIREQLNNCSWSYYFNQITWNFQRGRLALRGRVPTFYMKQVLQEMLRNIEPVKHIVNEVDVVSSNGLSSTRQEEQ
jgi:osmotically-inducible protein OsmY